MYIAIFYYRCCFIKVEILNLTTKSTFFYEMLITCKCTRLCKKLYCDTKNDSSYLATTHPCLYNN